ncbi:hypothetical protein P7C71_g3617, partial [Lecanoromycetidae sp. Uapishka_2]
MAPVSSPATKHVPAWKKLGLKLKFAKEKPDDITTHHTGVDANVRKRKSSGGSEFDVETAATDRTPKKAKTSKFTSRNEVFVNREYPTELPHEKRDPKPAAKEKAPSNKRKSVSFAPEAKTEDGEGAKQIYKKWVEEQIAIDPSFDPSSVSPALKSITPLNVRPSSPQSDPPLTKLPAPPPKKPKKPKVKQRPNPKSSQPSPSSSNTQTTHPALIYLNSYHTDTAHWKFSKPHQNHIFKHLFSLTHIPSSYDPALLSYLKGLKGPSARSRIRIQALAIREEDEKWLDNDPSENEKMDQETHAECKARRKRDYDAAVARMKAELREKEDEREEREWELYGGREEWEQRARKRRRAEIVLWGVGEDEDVVEDVVALPQSAIFRNFAPPATIQSKGMGGVEQISGTGVAKGSLAKKTVFGDDGSTMTNGANGGNVSVNGGQKAEAKSSLNGVKPRRKRRHNRRRTGVPDDDDSSSESSSSSSSSSDESETEGKAKPNGAMKQQANGRARLSDGETSSSDSGSSGSSSDDDSDSSDDGSDSDSD